MLNKNQSLELMNEFKKIGYGFKNINIFSKQAQKYIIGRYKRGITELKRIGKYPTQTGDNGYTLLLGVYYFSKSGGLDSAIGLKKVWMASILNNDDLI